MTPAFDPIAPWPLIALVALAITGLTLWAYRRKLRGTSGRWRWFALGLRLFAVLLCLLAAVRPSAMVLEKQSRDASVLFLTDVSSSMSLGGEAGGLTRIEAARKSLAEGVEAVEGLDGVVAAKSLIFDSKLRDAPAEGFPDPDGRLTALGMALEEAIRRFETSKVLRVVLLSDGASNDGPDPRAIARSLAARGIKVDAVGFGSEAAGAGMKDIAIRDLEAGTVVYAKTELEVFARLDAQGYPGQELEVELLEEGKATPVQAVKFRVPQDRTEIVLRGLKWRPEEPGERKLTLKVKPMPGELIPGNNETSTFVTVLKGGIGVLYLAGASSPWERKFLAKALDASEKIQLTEQVFFGPAGADLDPELTFSKYDVFILGDLPAEFLSREQRRKIADAARQGAGLLMLGGRHSFGMGGWAGTEIADLLPVEIHPGDGEVGTDAGLKVVPNTVGLDSYVLRVAPTAAETRAAWAGLPPISGANQFVVKQAANLWALTDGGQPVVASIETGRGRSLAVGGETWPWFRATDETSHRLHLNFWRNAILWLAHKEDEGDNQVRLELDRRRVALGQKLEITATARDAKGAPIPGVTFQAEIVRDGDPDAKPEPLQLYSQGESARASHYASGAPGEYRVELKATKGAEVIGAASARFIAFDDDRELRNPAADLALLKAIAEESGGDYLVPEQLADHIDALDDEVLPEYEAINEVRLWDNWPFLLLFTVVLTLEWWLRRRHGWV